MKKIIFLAIAIICSGYVYALNDKVKTPVAYNSEIKLKDILQQDSLHITNRHPKLGIIPGQLIGNIKINQSMESAVKFLGQPDDGDSAMGKTVAFWYTNHDKSGNKLAVYAVTDPNLVNGKRIIKVISVTSPGFVTEKGIHVGLSYKNISRAYKLKKMNPHMYSSANGISFEFDNKRKCKAIFVHDKNFNVNTIYLNM